MSIDPAVRALLDELGPERPFDLAAARAALSEYAELAPATDAEQVEVAGVPALHRPGTGPHVVWLHGGGFVNGSPVAAWPLCRALGERTGWAVTAPAYRLAPEHVFPAALEDATAVVRAVEGPVLVGESAGAALAVAAARSAPVAAVLLLCPWLDLTLAHARDTGDVVTTAALREYLRLYGADPTDPTASPLLGDATDDPPAVVVTAEHDPLRGDGVRYAAQTGAVHHDWPAMVHGFPGLRGLTPVAEQALDAAADALAELLA
jgi:acetyl esterase/lipase